MPPTNGAAVTPAERARWQALADTGRITLNGDSVTLPVGDNLLRHTANQYRRLIETRDAIDHLLAKRSDTLRQGLAERRKTALTIAGLDIHLNGNDVIVSVIDRRISANLPHSA